MMMKMKILSQLKTTMIPTTRVFCVEITTHRSQGMPLGEILSVLTKLNTWGSLLMTIVWCAGGTYWRLGVMVNKTITFHPGNQ